MNSSIEQFEAIIPESVARSTRAANIASRVLTIYGKLAVETAIGSLSSIVGFQYDSDTPDVPDEEEGLDAYEWAGAIARRSLREAEKSPGSDIGRIPSLLALNKEEGESPDGFHDRQKNHIQSLIETFDYRADLRRLTGSSADVYEIAQRVGRAEAMGDKTSASRAHSQLNEAILATRIRKYLPRTYQKANLAQDVDNIIESSKISTETDIEGVFDILCQQSVVVTPMKTELLPAVDYGDVSVATKLNNIKLNNLNKAKRQYDTQSNDQIKAMEKLAREHGEQSGDMTFSINFKSLLAHTKARLRWPSRTIARGQEISKAETPHRPILKRVVDSMVIASGLRDLPAARDASSDLEKLSGSNPTREYLNKIGFIAMEPHRDGPLIHEILGNNRIWSTNSQMFDAIIIRAKDEAQRENAANS